MSKTKEITLYCFAGKGDIINTTAIPELIKRSFPNIHIRYCLKSGLDIFFKNNPYIDEIVIVDEKKAAMSAHSKNTSKWNNLGIHQNEINLWALSGLNFGWNSHRKFTWGSAEIINEFFEIPVISIKDNLLPNLYYSEEEQMWAEEFALKIGPFVIVEIEYFSRQYNRPAEHIYSYLRSTINNRQVKICISLNNDKFEAINNSIKCREYVIEEQTGLTMPEKFINLENLNLRQMGLVINKAEAMYGLGSGLSAISFERTLVDLKNKFIFYLDDKYFQDYISHPTFAHMKRIKGPYEVFVAKNIEVTWPTL